MPHPEPTGGIDCGWTTLVAGVHPSAERRGFSNDEAGRADLRAWLRERGVRRVILEHSGGCERAARNELRGDGFDVHPVPPARVRHFAKAVGTHGKTDPADAVLLARFGATLVEGPPPEADPAREEMAGFVRLRAALVDKRADLVKAARAAPEAAARLVEAALTALAEAVAAVETATDRLVASAPSVADRVELLRTAPGVGQRTAVAVAVLMPELGRVSGGRAAALIGLAPYPDDSGDRSGPRHISGGRADVRRALYMAVLGTAGRIGGAIGGLHVRLTARGKPKKVVLVACMHKLLVRLNAMLAAGETWKEEPA